MNALEKVKYVLAQLPREDQAELLRFLDDTLLTDEEKEAALEGRGGHVATVTSGRRNPGGPRSGAGPGRDGDRGRPGAPAGGGGGTSRAGGAVTYRLEYVNCGKASCSKCPHGPYTYKYWREDGRLRKAYVGKAAKRRAASGSARSPDAPGSADAAPGGGARARPASREGSRRASPPDGA